MASKTSTASTASKASTASAEQLAERIFAENSKEQKREARQRRCTYLLVGWGLQILCFVLVFVALLWASIQLLRLTNFLLVSQEPPGLTYLVDYPDPPPPPPQLGRR